MQVVGRQGPGQRVDRALRGGVEVTLRKPLRRGNGAGVDDSGIETTRRGRARPLGSRGGCQSTLTSQTRCHSSSGLSPTTPCAPMPVVHDDVDAPEPVGDRGFGRTPAGASSPAADTPTGVRHSLASVLTVAPCAVLAGAPLAAGPARHDGRHRCSDHRGGGPVRPNRSNILVTPLRYFLNTIF